MAIALFTLNYFMKKMLLVATAVGGGIAGLILYAQKKNRGNKVVDAAKDAYRTMNDGIGRIERPAHHAMG